MKRFLRDVSLFALLGIALNLVNFLPAEWFTYRNWEALTYQRFGHFSYGAFYPNESTLRTEYGDLAHHSSFAIPKEDVVWRTDRLGNRNDAFMQAPDVVLVGDSDLTGSGVSQENTLVNLINEDGRYDAYSIAPKKMDEFVRMMADGVIEAPDVVVLERVEREILAIPPIRGAPQTFREGVVSTIRTNPVAGVVTKAMDRVHAQRPARYLQARLTGAMGLANSYQSSVDGSLFFYRYDAVLALNNYAPSDADVARVTARLVEYRDFLAARGVDFVFLPVPNKLTVYYDLLPLENQPTFLSRLIRSLEANDVRVVDTFELFNREAEAGFLYFKDDTHWNERAIRLAQSELLRELEGLN